MSLLKLYAIKKWILIRFSDHYFTKTVVVIANISAVWYRLSG
jgi:hypothetical protein